MHHLRTSLVALATLLAMGATAIAQESNPVTSNPPTSAIGRLSETSPGTPNRQNGTPGYRTNGYFYAQPGPYQSNTYGYYGGMASDGYYEAPLAFTPPGDVD